MKKIALITGLLSIATLAPLAQAASGTINFTGKLTAATCSITSGGGATTINIPLGTISVDQVPAVGATSVAATGSTTIDVTCTGTNGLNTVAMKFDPAAGSGFNPDNRNLLALTGGPTSATGVGIGLFDGANTLIELGSGGTLDTPLAPGTTPGETTAKIQVRAAYFKSTTTTPTAGEANGNMAFTMTYK